MKRNMTIPIRVTPVEYAQIKENAAKFGGKVSEFGRSQMLQSESGLSGAALQDMVSTLSRLAQATNEIEDYDLRSKFVKLEVELWQSIKLSTNPETTGQTEM